MHNHLFERNSVTESGDHHSQPPVLACHWPVIPQLHASNLPSRVTQGMTHAVFLCALRTCRKCMNFPPTPSARPGPVCFLRACHHPRHGPLCVWRNACHVTPLAYCHAWRRLYFCAHQASAIPCFSAPILNQSRVTNTLSSRAAKTVTRDKHFVVFVVVFSSLKHEQQHLTKSQPWRRVYTSPRGLRQPRHCQPCNVGSVAL